MIAAEQEREDVAAARAKWIGTMKSLDPASPVFIDESGFTAARTAPR